MVILENRHFATKLAVMVKTKDHKILLCFNKTYRETWDMKLFIDCDMKPLT